MNDAARTVWFYRDYARLAGGHVKHAHYFDHVRRMPGFTPRITFREAPANESLARELARYHPGLKLIVLLRDPAERAISSYYYQKNRGRERRPLWLALLLEPLRLRRPHDPRAFGSITRVCAYRRRGLYSRQLRNLYRHFDREQVLVLRTRDLEERHDAALRRVFTFLGVDEAVRIEPERANQADRGGRRHRLVSWLLRLTYLPEFARMRALARSCPDLAARGRLFPRF